MNSGFFYRPKHAVRATTCMVIAVVCFVLSLNHKTQGIREEIDAITNYFYILSNKTIRLSQIQNIQGFEALTKENTELQKEILQLKQALSNQKALETENKELQQLLGITYPQVAVRKVMRVLSLEQNSKNTILVVDNGELDHIYKGQNIFDGDGLVGQVISTSENQARILLITDPNSFVPVYVNGTNEQMMVKGSKTHALSLEFVRSKSTIKENDLLYTSGLGNRFFPNFPVAKVSRVQRDNNGSVVNAYAEPIAQLSSLKYLVATWPYCTIVDANESDSKNYVKNNLDNSLSKHVVNLSRQQQEQLKSLAIQAQNILNYNNPAIKGKIDSKSNTNRDSRINNINQSANQSANQSIDKSINKNSKSIGTETLPTTNTLTKEVSNGLDLDLSKAIIPNSSLIAEYQKSTKELPELQVKQPNILSSAQVNLTPVVSVGNIVVDINTLQNLVYLLYNQEHKCYMVINEATNR